MAETININVQGDDAVAYAGWALVNMLFTELMNRDLLTKGDAKRLYESAAEIIETSTSSGEPNSTSRRAGDMLRQYADILTQPD
ncbi:MAG: hypothetical protein U0X20_28820 [Caldilineaceae bacterium]